ncbi:Organic hydroperoxide resistance transcriptional regulator [Vibrio aerogenes CECT 7868]|uniref:Organic hydroperoxide resistance transcriptional regulator n=1 Tax=Vibrio aerogenes CECT 7868 TaxID=1216006 RepID=A0A1M5ZG75_9VIBR|nr:MarR family transcriptional regulator [Vibrio aerogenes]SHI23131.1 Organic hydroperoxide resistance transcriptional regulator [Vibrio aerogenes CECT 7868]
MDTSDKTQWLNLDKQVCFALYSASLAMNKLYRKVLKPLGLTYSQYLVLLTLWQQDGLSVSSIGEQLFLDSATLTPLLKRMESAELVIRQRSEQDERHVIIYLTDKAKSLRAQAVHIPEQVMCSTACDADALLEMKANLEMLRNNILDRL